MGTGNQSSNTSGAAGPAKPARPEPYLTPKELAWAAQELGMMVSVDYVRAVGLGAGSWREVCHGMTIAQIVALLEGDDRRMAESLRMSSAVWAGVAPTVSKEGYQAARRWSRDMERALGGG